MHRARALPQQTVIYNKQVRGAIASVFSIISSARASSVGGNFSTVSSESGRWGIGRPGRCPHPDVGCTSDSWLTRLAAFARESIAPCAGPMGKQQQQTARDCQILLEMQKLVAQAELCVE
jgi:hypothetical protein